MSDDTANADHWSQLLTDEQQEKLRWLQNHRCSVEVTRAAADPLHDLPSGFVLEVLVNKHAVVKIRSENLSMAFDYCFEAAKNLFDFVEAYDPMWRGMEQPVDPKPPRKK